MRTYEISLRVAGGNAHPSYDHVIVAKLNYADALASVFEMYLKVLRTR